MGSLSDLRRLLGSLPSSATFAQCAPYLPFFSTFLLVFRRTLALSGGQGAWLWRSNELMVA